MTTRYTITTLMIIALTVICGTTGALEVVDGLSMLRNEHGARALGMGAASVSISADPNAVAYNPAAAVGLDKFTASFGHTEHWENVRLESAFFGIGLTSNLYLQGGIRYATDKDLEQRGLIPTAEPEALFDAHDASFKSGLAYRVSEMVSVGVAAGWFLEEIEGYRGSAFNVDLGVVTTPRPNLNVAAAVTNLGSDFNITKAAQTGSSDIPLPTTYRIGASYTHRYLLGALDIVHIDDKAHVHMGAEAELQEMLDIRAGYMTGYDTKDFAAGASFKYRNIIVDYAFVPYSSNLGTSHLFNLTFSL